jgi:hypothetical protein
LLTVRVFRKQKYGKNAEKSEMLLQIKKKCDILIEEIDYESGRTSTLKVLYGAFRRALLCWSAFQGAPSMLKQEHLSIGRSEFRSMSKAGRIPNMAEAKRNTDRDRFFDPKAGETQALPQGWKAKSPRCAFWGSATREDGSVSVNS